MFSAGGKEALTRNLAAQVFFFGDLNYRVDEMETEEILALAARAANEARPPHPVPSPSAPPRPLCRPPSG